MAAYAPLKIDGDIGPKTTGAFRRFNRHAGPDALSRRFGRMLGFIR